MVSFTCLKSFAFDQRFERKDAHDLIYCIEHAAEGLDAVGEAFRKERDGKHGAVIQASLAILRNRFAQDDKTEGLDIERTARCRLPNSNSAKATSPNIERCGKRQTSDVIDQLMARIGQWGSMAYQSDIRWHQQASRRSDSRVERRAHGSFRDSFFSSGNQKRTTMTISGLRHFLLFLLSS